MTFFEDQKPNGKTLRKYEEEDLRSYSRKIGLSKSNEERFVSASIKNISKTEKDYGS